MRLILAAVLIAASTALADAPKPAASQPAATVEKILEDLSRIDAAAVKAHLDAVQGMSKKLANDNAALKAKIAANEAEMAKLAAQLQLLDAILKVKAAGPTSMPAPIAAATKPAAPAPAPKMAAAPPAPPPAPPATPAAVKPEVTYADHILPIINEKCAGCHNADKARGGLVLVTFADAMQGGSSGKVIQPGSPENSRLFKLVSHLEEPFMPPMQAKLDDAKLATIKKWIQLGAPQDVNSKVMLGAAAPAATDKPVVQVDTDLAPMPANLPKGPIKKPLFPPAAIAVATSPVADLLAVGGETQIFYFQASTRELLGLLDYPEGRAEYVTFSQDGTWLVAAGGQTGKSGSVVVFDVESGQRVGQFDKLYDTVLAAAVSPDTSSIAVGGTNNKVRVFDAYGGTKTFEITTHNDWIQAIDFSPDGLLLATADRAGGLYVWESDTGREVHNLRAHTGAITSISFRADSQMLASTGKDGTVRLWGMEAGNQIRQWAAHSPWSLCVRFSADGRLATCGADGLTRLWDQNGTKVREFPNQNDWIYRVAFTPDAKTLIAGTFTGALALFETDTGKLLGKLSTIPQ